MAEIFDFYVNDNRSITFKLSEPIMLEDNGVSDWRFHIPNTVNGLDATDWQWWLVYVNARNDKYTIPLTLEYDYDRPDAYSIATYTVDYGMSCKVGNVRFSLEAIDADTGGTILHEWHTKTYSTNVVDTLQGNQIEYDETESDLISALLIEVRNRTNQLIGGATPTPVSAVSEMLDTDKLYLLTTDGEWYYYNGTTWVSGGVYGAGVVDPVPTQGSSNAVSSGGVHSALAEKANAIIVDGDYSTTHINTGGVSSDITIKGNSFTRFTAKIANKANECPSLFATSAKGITYTADGHFHRFSGTTTASFNNMALIVGTTLAPDALLGKTVKLFVKSNIPVDFSGRTDGKTSTFQVSQNSSTILTITPDPTDIFNVEGTFTLSANSGTKIGLTLPNFPAGINMTGVVIWYGMYVSDSFASTDTQQTIADGNTINVTAPSGYSVIDTFMHESAIPEVADTKEYVDNHIPSDVLTAEDLIYVTPEMFGAVGDGTTDDNTAVQNCINNAITNGVPVRGFGKYNIGTTKISIVGDFLDIFLNRIEYTGNDVAVEMTGSYCTLRINYLNAYSSTGSGFRLVATSSMNCRSNDIYLTAILAYNNCIEMVNNYVNMSLFYNKIHTTRLYSRYGNCIYLDGADYYTCAENSVYGKNVNCQRGWAVYNSDTYRGNRTNRFYELGIEAACANGLKGIGMLINCRTGECMDLMKDDPTKGTIYKPYKINEPGMLQGSTPIQYASYDISDCDSYEERIAVLKEKYEGGETKWRSFNYAFPSDSMRDHVIGGTNIRISSYSENGGTACPEGYLIGYLNHKGYVPKKPWYHKITVSDYYCLTTDNCFPTIFDIDVTTNIHLDDSYCAVGISNFKVIQYANKTAKVYDKNETLIFDGTNKGEGTYSFECHMTNHTLTVETASETLEYTCPEGHYFGTNEEWTVEKLNIIT